MSNPNACLQQPTRGPCVKSVRSLSEVYLVAAKNVDNDQHVGDCNQPCGTSDRQHDVALHLVSKGPVARECHAEVAVGDASVCEGHPPHVRLEGAVLDARLGRQGGLHVHTNMETYNSSQHY